MKKTAAIKSLIKKLLHQLSIDQDAEGLIETPERVAEMYEELLEGYNKNPKTVFKTFENGSYDGLIVISNIQFYSLCEHHMIPFFGKVNIGYVPNKRILGLSKFARLVNIFSRRLQVQERLTDQLAESIMEYLNPHGVVVSIEAEHLCMSMRGINKPGSTTKTLVTRGVCASDRSYLQSFFTLIKE